LRLSMRLPLVRGLTLSINVAINVARAQGVLPDTVEAHLAAGKRAVGGRDGTPEFYGLVTAICVAPQRGTEFNFPNDVEHFDQYLASVRRQAELARAAGATVIINNQSQFKGAADRLRMLADRSDGERHPLDFGADAVGRYLRSRINAPRRSG
jgi:hypothetical protein